MKNKQGIMLDIGCGENKQPNFVGMDYRPLKGVDIVHDVEVYPWPVKDESVLTAVASHLVEHLNPHGGNFIKFMDEVWRVLKFDGQFAMSMPYAGSHGYFQDPTHCNPCNETTWEYFDPLGNSGLYRIYKPRPWKIEHITFQRFGNMEVILRKRRPDKSYEM